MAKRFGRKPRYFRIKFIKAPGRTRQRIKIPQPPHRPITVRKDLVDRDYLSEDPWWFVKHRRGVRRPRVGLPALEARAVSEGAVRGTLPERVVYKALTQMRMVPDVDFDFQSSLLGGRLELGGIVADFLFREPRNFVINVQGPTHERHIRKRKDAEQEDLMKDMGLDAYYLTTDEIANADVLWWRLRQIFNYGPGAAGGLDQAMTQDEQAGDLSLATLEGSTEELEMLVENL